MRIYLASSWRNAAQPLAVEGLRAAGHVVYDFRNPAPGNTGFQWASVDPDWQAWSPEQFRNALNHPVANHGFHLDMEGIRNADVTVLLLPCGRSAHLELGYAHGAGKRTAILMLNREEPELMYRMVDKIAFTMDELLAWLEYATRRSEA